MQRLLTLVHLPQPQNETKVTASAVPFVAADKCTHNRAHARKQYAATICQASDCQQIVNRRGLVSAGISLAVAAQLQSVSPADALIVSKEWEKVHLCCHYLGLVPALEA